MPQTESPALEPKSGLESPLTLIGPRRSLNFFLFYCIVVTDGFFCQDADSSSLGPQGPEKSLRDCTQ